MISVTIHRWPLTLTWMGVTGAAALTFKIVELLA